VGKIPEAVKMARNTRALYRSRDSDNIKLGNQIDRYLSWFLLQSGSLAEAEQMAKENLKFATAKIEDNWYIESSKSHLAATLIAQGKLTEAQGLYGNFPTYPGLDREFNIQGQINPDDSDILLIVFWEEWCPYCDRLMAKAEELYRQYHNYGIDVVGVTKLSKTSDLENCDIFLKRHNISFPIIKESGKASNYFNVTGVPSVRLVYKGKLIWNEKVPSAEPISRYMLEGLVKAQQSL